VSVLDSKLRFLIRSGASENTGYLVIDLGRKRSALTRATGAGRAVAPLDDPIGRDGIHQWAGWRIHTIVIGTPTRGHLTPESITGGA